MADTVASSVLVVYGEPPTMDLVDDTGRKLNKTFALTLSNKASFEKALRHALGGLLGDHVSLADARLIFVKDANAFYAAVKSSGATRLIYYGHALTGTNALRPSLGKSIATFQLIDALKGTRVADFDILGCSSTSIAAEVATGLRGTRVGYLRTARKDSVEVDPTTLRVKGLKIDRQAIFHFEPKK